eukprot:TRINITY_DN45260_c0_g1_i1.p1 TRINITY_DN45260_c0_g1~~TRINITY_DN45260_c0_g1_i1.p1  ORF type:complete len:143 (+),score=2.66 TRINITY_DN45260_c0_g1_i1:58-486(+)
MQNEPVGPQQQTCLGQEAESSGDRTAHTTSSSPPLTDEDLKWFQERKRAPLPHGLIALPIAEYDWGDAVEDDTVETACLRAYLYACEHVRYFLLPTSITKNPKPDKQWFNAEEIDAFESWMVIAAYKVPEKRCPMCRKVSKQ